VLYTIGDSQAPAAWQARKRETEAFKASLIPQRYDDAQGQIREHAMETLFSGHVPDEDEYTDLDPEAVRSHTPDILKPLVSLIDTSEPDKEVRDR
jgi:hypothetical protein